MENIITKGNKGTMVLEIGDWVTNDDVVFTGFVHKIDPDGKVKVIRVNGETRWFDADQLERLN